jgi:hypothetical protein
LIAALSFVLPFFLFIAFPSHMWNFDGVACAAALELGNPTFLFHSNHMLYGFFGFIFWRLITLVAAWRALPALQLFTSLQAAGGCAGIYFILTEILANEKLSLGITLCVSVSAVVWVWSVEAQVYALGFLALIWATRALLRPERPKKWIVIGLLHAGAILGHVVHVLWFVPAMYWLWKENTAGKRKKFTQYLITVTLTTLIPYALVIGILIVPHHLNDRWLGRWLMGSAALNPNSVFQWHLAGWTAPLVWAGTTLRIFWGSFWPYQTNVPAWAWALTAASAGCLGFLLAMSLKNRRERLWIFCALWLAIYGIFFWTWEPATECYRMTDLAPLAILIALGVQAVAAERRRWQLTGILFLTLFPLNLRTRIVPMSNPRRNLLYQQIMDLTQATPDNSLYLTAGGSAWIYILYFTGRTAWDLHAFARDPVRLESEIKRHLAMQPGYVQAAAVQSGLAQPWLEKKLGPRVDELPWYRLR